MAERLDLRPVVAWDVDGVIRVREGYTDLPLIAKEITFFKGDYPREYHGQPRWDSEGKSEGTDHFSPSAVELLNLIQEESLADQVLATTWQGWANTYFAGPLGLPELPVAVVSKPESERYFAHCSPDWKSEQLSRQFDGRPLLWIDDNPTDRPHEDFIERRLKEDRGITAFYQTDWRTGIVQADIVRILEWIQDASSKEGQAKLRAQYDEDIAAAEKAREAYEERRRFTRGVFNLVKERALNLWPGQTYLAHSLANYATHEDGLVVETLRYVLARNRVVYDPEKAFYELRVEGFHKKYTWE